MRSRWAAEVRHLERQLLHPEVRSDRKRLHTLLAADFVEFASSGGVFNKRQVIAALLKEEPATRRLSNFRATRLAENLALVTYRASRKTRSGMAHSLRSSLWRRTRGRWQLAFHQGTPSR
jgi:hypothetical protein